MVGAGWCSLWDNFFMEKVIAPVIPGRSAVTVAQAHGTATLAVLVGQRFSYCDAGGVS